MKYVEGSKRVFLDTGTRFQRRIVQAIGIIKVAAARTNVSLGLLDRATGEAIIKAGEEVMRGKFDDSVVGDVCQTGSGTGINMNANELIAEEASRLLGRKVHPNDHVNMGQSSNDVGPSRMRGLKFVKARNTFRAIRLLTDLASLSGGLRSIALDLYRLCQDLRLMFSGPITGLGEIDIPTQEEVAGSSIMPGKTNPVTVES